MSANDATWIGVAMAGIALIGTIVGNLVSYFKDRDKLIYDRKVVQLEAKVGECEEKHALTQEKLTKCEEGHQESSARHDETERRLAALEQRGK